MKNFLQGKWLGHPIHPILVHFPVGLFVLSLLLDIASITTSGGNALVRAAFYTMVLGTLLGVVAAVPGLADWSSIRADHPGKPVATYHMYINLAMLLLYGLNTNMRYVALRDPHTPVVSLVLSVIGVGLISVSGYLGGKLVYDEGIGVGRHLRAAGSPLETLHATSTSGGAAAFVPVAPARALADGATLRAEVNGNVMTIARVDGEYFAFQEFCTHRYGPLSEGLLNDGQVQCPWHGSCFDVRTGKVTGGPAKTDLKTYDVRIEDGQIAVRAPKHAS